MRALIFGATGQDGSYLAELLLAKGYEVIGTRRPTARANPPFVAGFEMACCDITDAASVEAVVKYAAPDEIYNLAAQSHVGSSFAMPAYTSQVTGLGALNILEAFRRHAPAARFYQASSSEMFGNQSAPQNENTPFAPVSPYGVAKLFAHNTALNYRKTHGLHVSCGIMFNHESPRRGEQFVTRKIAKGLAQIKAGLQEKLMLGNLDATRDWGYAPEYVEAMWKMLQRDEPDDFVIGTGRCNSVRGFLLECLELSGLGLPHSVVGIEETSKRPSEIHCLKADPWKAKARLDWEAKTFMPELARIMMEAELKAVGL
jgi:GDPmannose 4,6-dehydratase